MVILRASSNEVLPEDVYSATLARVEEETGANGLYLKWLFQVKDELIPGFTGTSAAPQAKARKWVEALAGRPVEDGETIDLEGLYGNLCRVYISVVNGRSDQMNRVERVLPAARGQEDPLDNEGCFRRVHDRGIFLKGHWYYHPALAARVGQDLFVRPDPLGGPEVHVYTPENWYICSAGRVGVVSRPVNPSPTQHGPARCPECGDWTVRQEEKTFCQRCGWRRKGAEETPCGPEAAPLAGGC